jgi:hypothetical protein
MIGRDRVIKALEFGSPDRVPRDLWWDPAVEITQKEELRDLLERFSKDISTPEYKRGISERQKGHLIVAPGLHSFTAIPIKGKWIDEWGSIRHVGEDGLFGEVKEPVLDDLSKIDRFFPPWEYLESTDLSEVNRSCAESDKFMLSDICARPFERMQFIRGTENFFMDLAYGSKEVSKLRDMVHEYNLKHIKMWLKTDVDAIFMMDDWGAQNNLLISPPLWREFLKPLYAEYCDLIHEYDKYVFFHSDGHIEEIFDDVIEIGIDAINSQLFCMDIEKLAEKYKGKITFWGEIDRQRLLPFGDPDEITEAVYRVRRAFDDGIGGLIAQCDWGKNNPSKNIEAVFNAWSEPLEGINGNPR